MSAAEVERLQAEVDTLTELLSDALPKLVERLRLRAEVATLAGWLLSEWVWVHETKIAEVDELLRPYLGGSDD